MANWMHKLARVGYVVAVNLAVLVAGIVVLELFFGSWFDETSYGRLNVLRNVNRVMDVSELYPSDGPVVYRRDRHGLRGAHADPSQIDVLAIGGSTTNEFYITEDRTWTAVMQHALSEAGRELTVANAGVDGQSTRGHLYNFEAWFPKIPDLSPRYVLAYIGVNDLEVEDESNRFDQILDRKPTHRTLRYYKNHSALYRAFLIVKGLFEARFNKVVHGAGTNERGAWVAATDLPRPADDWAAQRAAYARRIQALASKIRGIGATPVFMTQPAGTYLLKNGVLFGRQRPGGRVDVGMYFKLVAFNSTLLETCEEHGYLCFDISSVAFDDGDFYDNVHTTPSGSHKIGRFAAAQFLERVVPQGGASKAPR